MAMKAQDAPGHEHIWGADLHNMKAHGTRVLLNSKLFLVTNFVNS